MTKLCVDSENSHFIPWSFFIPKVYNNILKVFTLLSRVESISSEFNGHDDTRY